MEAHRLGGGIAPLNFKLGTRQMWVMRLNPLSTLLPDKKHWFTLNWRLGGYCSWSGCFGEDIALLLLPRLEPKIFLFSVLTMQLPRFEPPDLTAYILVSLLTVLPHTDLKIKQKSVLRKWDGRFGLGVFDSWQEFLESFSEHDNICWSFVRWDFLYWIMSNIIWWWKWGNWY